ncbi:histidine ammonia-lyase-like [Paramacrobiotus metropolitanus]|uniref:histidine ammonia-lyase-like n=1 Tax=Paramacrobiotus metropolitanus TaxID=2943436 RepID=UPI0024461014|nr:histidine ammonia-lyase-like [Paramacrobiotus metropolitanus]
MKIFARVGSESFTVPCAGNESIRWLIEETLKRATKKLPGSLDIVNVRKVRGGAMLDENDQINTILHDEEHVVMALKSDAVNGNGINGHNGHVYNEMSNGLPVETCKTVEPHEFLLLDGNSLSCEDLFAIGRRKYKIHMTKEAQEKVLASRNLLEEIIRENRVVYGVNTGFGKFARTIISKDDLDQLQLNLIRSHAAGVGDCLPLHRIRMMLALRINVLAKGYSGISLQNLNKMIDIFNASCLSFVPEQGTVGASGDLAPLSHLALGMIGEGKMWSPETGWADAKSVLEFHKLPPIVLGPKEGIALINGTQLIAALGAEAIERAENAALQADVIAALSLDVLKGTTKAYDSAIHYARPHKGQIAVAQRFRALLHSSTHPSEIAGSHRFCARVQDAYTLRCCPQVHGVVHDTIEFVKGILTTELNSATDNPMVFAEKGETMSGGNFHGEYPAKALDYLAIGIHEVASMSERRIERLCNPSLSELPAFLTANGGLNNGFMLAHCSAAALVSENKVLCHPSSIDSLSTSAATEDHVSMGGWSARKALKVIENVERVLAIELLAACQAIEFLRPLKTTAPLEDIHQLVRTVVGPWDKDRYMAPDIEAATALIVQNKLWSIAKPHIDHYFAQENTDRRFTCDSPTSSQILISERDVAKRRKVSMVPH